MTQKTTETVGLIGLGAMGARLGARLLGAGIDLVVHNRTRARAEPLLEQGARWAETPAALASECDLVITLVTDDDAARAVWLDPETGALGGLAAGAVAVESSTVTPAWVGELAGHITERGAHLLDAPVVGSRPQAEAGALVYLVGGDAAALERARPIFEVTGGATHHVGPVGRGALTKLAVNALFATQVAALAEVLGALEASGMARGEGVELLGQLAITSPAMRGIGGLIASGADTPMFPVELVEKDLRYAAGHARSAGAAVPVIEAAREVFERAKGRGLGGANIHRVAALYLPDAPA